ncbi:MAG: hypothetical protein PHO91_02335 [Patescibacteria group bacterium]|nr:hypothetical protein [Patescibacteria group bacterium]
MLNNFNSSQNLRLIRQCPICNIEYRQNEIQILDESELGALTYASCQSCGANLLTKFAALPQGLIGNAILTDLQPQEVLEFAAGDDLRADDVLSLYQLISKKELISSLKKLI